MNPRHELKQLERRREATGKAIDEKVTELRKVEHAIDSKKDRDPKTKQRRIDLHKEIAKLQADERELTQRIDDLRDRHSELQEKIEDVKAEIKANREKRVVVQASAPHWGGSQDIIENEVVPIMQKYGPITSRKRAANDPLSIANPGSDHNAANTTAGAADCGIADRHDVADEIGRALGVGPVSDYAPYYFKRAGRTFRVQLIASQHGTGPHLHCGIRLV